MTSEGSFWDIILCLAYIATSRFFRYCLPVSVVSSHFSWSLLRFAILFRHSFTGVVTSIRRSHWILLFSALSRRFARWSLFSGDPGSSAKIRELSAFLSTRIVSILSGLFSRKADTSLWTLWKCSSINNCRVHMALFLLLSSAACVMAWSRGFISSSGSGIVWMIPRPSDFALSSRVLFPDPMLPSTVTTNLRVWIQRVTIQ